ncbi:hypothetical protein G9G63_09670 [Paenibacillus sp. EKM202P]|uniref:hypothetical protein n=1 Tax=unclassified Paenibacillus TaxID=185978 RepID=UPI0013EC0A74|nr:MULTISPECIES: hypothetical protein [unclassified Paenibacillus]KAF6565415.1 hypothetical protein G9G63_09670 [Paenibacillus sp. EKM202P]KAF6569260.1 hypothetical protein G9G64_12425 [Paenibacillus sp. EKM207P]
MKTFSSIQKQIFEAMKVEDMNKGRLFKRLIATGAAPACKRCGGSGRYSFNLKDGSTCYGCGGAGVIIKDESELLKIVESQGIQDKLTKYLNELESKKQPKTKTQVSQEEIRQPEQPEELLNDLYQDAIKRMDWEFVVRIMILLKNKDNQIEGKQANEKQINYIKSLISKKQTKTQSDKDNLIQFIDEFEAGKRSLNHTEVNYIINWLKER